MLQGGVVDVRNQPELTPFLQRQTELSIERQVILWGMRLVVPVSLQPKVLQLLHEDHSGVSRMKDIARSHV